MSIKVEVPRAINDLAAKEEKLCQQIKYSIQNSQTPISDPIKFARQLQIVGHNGTTDIFSIENSWGNFADKVHGIKQFFI